MLKYISLILGFVVVSLCYQDDCDGDHCTPYEMCDAGVCTCPYGMTGDQCEIPCNVTLRGLTTIEINTDTYRNLMRCEWIIPRGTVIDMKLESFNIEVETYLPSRCYDVLEINFKNKPNTFHCGQGESIKNSTILQYGDSVRFFTDFTQLGNGFKFNLVYLEKGTDEDVVTDASTRSTTTPDSNVSKSTLKSTCTLKPVPGEPDYYYLGGYKMKCAKKTTFSLELCTCVHKQ